MAKKDEWEWATITMRLRPITPRKANLIRQLIGADRWIWNEARRHLLNDIERTGRCNYSFKDGENDLGQLGLGRWYTARRRETPWMLDLSYEIPRAGLRAMEGACKRHFQDPAQYGFPKKKRKFSSTESFVIPHGKFTLTPDRRHLHIPKLGWVRLSGPERHLDAEVREVRVKMECGKPMCYLQARRKRTIRTVAPEDERVVGIDRNASNLSLHDGTLHQWDEDGGMAESAEERARLQREIARLKRLGRRQGRKKPSRRCRKLMRLLARTHQKERRKAHDWRHKATTDIARKHDVAVIEDMSIKKLTPKGGGRRGRDRNRKVRSIGMYAIERMLAVKMHRVEKVNPAYTSRRCSGCGHTEKANRPSRAVFLCRACGLSMHADHNAARNILAARSIPASGTGATGRGGGGEGSGPTTPAGVTGARPLRGKSEQKMVKKKRDGLASFGT